MNKITLAFGSGGRLTNDLIKKLFVKKFSNKILEELEDSAVLNIKNKKIAFTTDSYVVNPIFFPGGDIGKIAVCGTVNDLSVKGAKPIAISCAFIIEEGLDFSVLEKIVSSMAIAAKEANVKIVTGDTKVVERGKADKIFINTSGVGIIEDNINISQKNLKGGEFILINGEIASHGTSVMNIRNNLGIKGNIKSDVAPLNEITYSVLDKVKVKCMRDVTRGGLNTILNEVASSCGLNLEIDETLIPISEEVKGACSILGLDPLYVANEGKVIIFVDEKDVNETLRIMKKNKYGKKSCIIGRVLKEKGGNLKIKTAIGSHRYAVMFEGEQLPRIC